MKENRHLQLVGHETDMEKTRPAGPWPMQERASLLNKCYDFPLSSNHFQGVGISIKARYFISAFLSPGRKDTGIYMPGCVTNITLTLPSAITQLLGTHRTSSERTPRRAALRTAIPRPKHLIIQCSNNCLSISGGSLSDN